MKGAVASAHPGCTAFVKNVVIVSNHVGKYHTELHMYLCMYVEYLNVESDGKPQAKTR